jgi:signal peptide peptidase SppA
MLLLEMAIRKKKMRLHRFLDTPLALRDVTAAEMLKDMKAEFFGAYQDDPEASSMTAPISGERTYSLTQGVALIPISGVLVSGNANPWYDERGYSDIENDFSSAMNDTDVKAVALQIGSPGGEVSGLFDLADTLYSMRGNKPVWSILDDHAYSAAYALASATDRIIVPRTGGVGSIGVITMHVDISKMLEDNGVKVSIIQYGDRKSDYSLFKPLSVEAQTRLQGHIDSVGEMFVEMVGRNRKLSKTKVRSTEAGIFMGKDGVEAGLADDIMSPQQAFAKLIDSIS